MAWRKRKAVKKGNVKQRKGRAGRRHKRYEPELRMVQRNLQIDKRLKLPLPQRYQTTLDITMVGVIPMTPNGLGATGFGIYRIKGNSLWVPFNHVSFTTSTTFTMAAAGSGLLASTMQPAGYSNFMGASATNFYNYSRVLASRISATVCPQVAGDAVSVVIVPANPVSAAQFNAVETASSAPFSKGAILCTGNNNVKMNRLSNYISSAEFFGAPPSAVLIEDNYGANYNADPSDIFDWYVVLQTTDGAINASPISIDIRVKYYVQFEYSTGAGLKDT